jgi:STE24 endopeptidase
VLSDCAPSPEKPLKRTPGLKAALAAGALVYALLFTLTTFTHSEAAEVAAAKYFTHAEIANGLRYAFQRRLFFWTSTALQLLFLSFVVFTGFARRLADWCARLLPGPRAAEPRGLRRLFAGLHWLATVLLVGAFCFLAVELLLLPVRLARLENTRAWGMTQRSVWSWLEQYRISLAVAGALGAVLLGGLYVLIRLLPRRWWVVGATASVLLGFFYSFLLPEVINPLFNTFTPLRDPDLLKRVRALAARAGVPVENVLVMDASRQGRHKNAYFTGFGPTRRIVLYDNLLQPLHARPPESSAASLLGVLASPHGTGPPAAALELNLRHELADEIESVLAHEIGHWRHDHILKGILIMGVGAYVGLFLVSVILRWAVNRAPFALRNPWDPAGVPLVLLLGVLGSWVVAPVENAVSRHFERQADETALELAEHPQAFIAAERRLARDNLANVAPTPFSVWLFASHPPTVDRIQMAQEWRKQRPR